MNSKSWAFSIIGVIVLLAGIVFTLQGADVVGGSSVMNGNSFWLYAGGVIAVLGAFLIVTGIVHNSQKTNVPATGAAS